MIATFAPGILADEAAQQKKTNENKKSAPNRKIRAKMSRKTQQIFAKNLIFKLIIFQAKQIFQVIFHGEIFGSFI